MSKLHIQKEDVVVNLLDEEEIQKKIDDKISDIEIVEDIIYFDDCSNYKKVFLSDYVQREYNYNEKIGIIKESGGYTGYDSLFGSSLNYPENETIIIKGTFILSDSFSFGLVDDDDVVGYSVFLDYDNNKIALGRTRHSYTNTGSSIIDYNFDGEDEYDIELKIKKVNSYLNYSFNIASNDDEIYSATKTEHIDSTIPKYFECSLAPNSEVKYKSFVIKKEGIKKLVVKKNCSEFTLQELEVVNDLTTDDATKVLSAKQGKVLNDMIGDINNYINS